MTALGLFLWRRYWSAPNGSLRERVWYALAQRYG